MGNSYFPFNFIINYHLKKMKSHFLINIRKIIDILIFFEFLTIIMNITINLHHKIS